MSATERLRRGSAGSSLTVGHGFITEGRPQAHGSGITRTLLPLVIVGVLNTALPYSLYAYGFDYGVEVGTAAVIAGTAPLMTAILAAFLLPAAALTVGPSMDRRDSIDSTPRLDLNSPALGDSGSSDTIHGSGQRASFSSLGGPRRAERLRSRVRHAVIGLIMGFCGIVLLSAKSFAKPAHGKGDLTLGDVVCGHLIIITAVFSKAAASVLAHKLLAHVRVLPLALGQTAAGAAVALVTSFIVDYTGAETQEHAKGWEFLSLASPGAWGAIAYLGLCSSYIVYVLQFFLVKEAGAVRQMLVDYLTPVVGIVEGAIFKGELSHLSGWEIAADVGGIVLVAIGVGLVNHVHFCGLSMWSPRRPSSASADFGDVHMPRDRGSRQRPARARDSVERPKAFSVTEVPPTEYPMFAAPTDRLLDSQAHGDI